MKTAKAKKTLTVKEKMIALKKRLQAEAEATPIFAPKKTAKEKIAQLKEKAKSKKPREVSIFKDLKERRRFATYGVTAVVINDEDFGNGATEVRVDTKACEACLVVFLNKPEARQFATHLYKHIKFTATTIAKRMMEEA